MNKFCGLDNVVIDSVLLRQWQTCLWREERGQSLTLLSIRNLRTGEKAHAVYELEVDKRDIEHEALYVDNVAVLDGENLDDIGMYSQDLTNVGENPPSMRTDEIDELLAECWEGEAIISS